MAVVRITSLQPPIYLKCTPNWRDYTYDHMDKLLSTSTPGLDENNIPVAITTSNTYDWAGKILTQTDARGNITRYTYDQRERLSTIKSPIVSYLNEDNIAINEQYITAYYYDRAGRKIAEVAANDYDPNISDYTQMNRTEYTYDKMDRVKTKKYIYFDTVNNQEENFVSKAYEYDAKGNKIKELDALGYESVSGYGTLFTYDAANRLLTVRDPESQDRALTTTKYDYDGVGRKIKETNAKGVVTSYIYDDINNIVKTKVNEQLIQTNTYDLVGNILTQTDGNDHTVTNQYNAWNKLKQIDYPGDATIPASTITFQYDVNGNLKKKTNSAGPVDLYIYDNQGRELSHTQQKADGTQSITISTRYDKAGNQRFTVDGNNVITEKIYNEVNRLTSSKVTVYDINNAPNAHEIRYGYDANGNQTTKTDWLGTYEGTYVEMYELGTYTNVYDPLNRLIEKRDPKEKSIEKLGYNHNSAQIKSTDALNKENQFNYDKNNRLIGTIDPRNHVKSQTYDEVGKIKTSTDGRGNITTFNYDEFNRLISVVNAKNETTEYTYDLNGNKLTQTVGKTSTTDGFTTIYEYNVANKLTKKIDHGGLIGPDTYDLTKTESYTYDAAGNLATKIDRNGYTTNYTYDVHGRMLSQSVDTLTVSYTYDENGNQLTMTDSTGTTTNTYDELNRIKTKEIPGTGTLTFLYDITIVLSSGEVAQRDSDSKDNITTKIFDIAGRMVSVTAEGQTTKYTYYDNGSKHMVVYPSGCSEEYTYYDDGLLHTLINRKGDQDQTIIDSYTYDYDGAHNLISKVDGKGNTNYTYDNLNRLETVTEPNGKVTTYTFDAAGNRETQTETQGTTTTVTTYTYNEQNRLISTLTQQNSVMTETAAYIYDNNGNQLRVTEVFYLDGIPRAGQVKICTYDKLNQLITIQHSADNSPLMTILTNTYNGLGLRVAKQVGSQTTKYVYAGDKVVLELDGENNQTAFNIQGTSLIARTVSGTTLYYMYNGHADVTALIDAAGTIQATYYYDAFGNILESTGNVNNPFTYAGYQYDKESKYYYLNSRYYDPVTARFLSEDTFTGNKNDPLSLNLYTYCHNEPLMYSDPTGHVEVYGNETDIANARDAWGDDGYNYHITTEGDHLTSSDLPAGSVIVGGTGAGGGVGGEADPTNGVIRIWGNSEADTIVAMANNKPSNDVNSNSNNWKSYAFGRAWDFANLTGHGKEMVRKMFGPNNPISPSSYFLGESNYGSTEGTREADNGNMHVLGFFTDRPTLSEHRDHVLNQLNNGLLEYKRSIGLVDDGGTPHLTNAEVEYNKEMADTIVYGNVAMLGGAALGAAVKYISPIFSKIGGFFDKGTGSTLSGKWIKVNESMSDASRAYQKQITGREGEAFIQNGVKFEGVNNGTLLEAKGSYNNFVNKKTGEFYDWFKGKDSLINQANRQINASEGAQMNWYFSEEASMNATKSLFQSQGINRINFIFEALK